MKWIAIIIAALLVIAVYAALAGDDGDDSLSAPRALPESRPPTIVSLENQIQLSKPKCESDEARGAVINDSAVTVDVFIDVQFLDSKGVVIDDSMGSVSGLRPREEGRWDAPYLGDGRYSKCRAEISSVFSH